DDTELRLFSRKGAPIGVTGQVARYLDPEFSPDGLRVAVAKIDSDLGTSTISVIDLADGRIEAVTNGRTWDRSPVWSAEGLLFSSRRGGPFEIYQKTVGAGRSAEPVHTAARGIALDRAGDGTILSQRVGSEQLAVTTAAGVAANIESRFSEK